MPDYTENPGEERKAKDKATALLPKDFFPGDKELKPGNVCRVKIDKVYDDQISVTYMKEEAEPEEEMVAEVDEVEELMA